MSSYSYKLTEEIARWAFEVHLKALPDWTIVFTNPTAGPWKRIESHSIEGKKGEVYRFQRDSERPDIVAVNDKIATILIFEAKDSLPKLGSLDQAKKSCKVVVDMAQILNTLEENNFWHKRAHYKTYNALLWGEKDRSEARLVSETFSLYKKILASCPDIDNTVMIGIEVRKNADGKLVLMPHASEQNATEKDLLTCLALDQAIEVDAN